MARRPGSSPSLSLRVAAAGYALIVIVSVAIAATQALQPIDRTLLSAQFSALRAFWPREIARDVVLVGIDDESVKRLPEPISLWHPHFARFLQATAAGGASAVGLDVVFPDRSYDSVVPGYDKALLLGILAARRAAPLIVSRTIDPEGRARPVHPVFMAAAGPESMAYALLPADSDGVVRRFDERLGASDEPVPTLAGELARRLGAPRQSGIIDFGSGTGAIKPPFSMLRTACAWTTTPGTSIA